MNKETVNMTVRFDIWPVSDGYVGVCPSLGMLMDGESIQIMVEKSERLFNFMLKTFAKHYSEDALFAYFDRHGFLVERVYPAVTEGDVLLAGDVKVSPAVTSRELQLSGVVPFAS